MLKTALPLVAALALLAPRLASAQPAAAVSTEPASDPAPASAGATAVAAVPGLVAHGAGHWLLGQRRTARRLLIAQAVGLGVAAVGGVPILVSGASAKLSGPAIPLVFTGTGSFILGWMADIYGSAGAGRIAGGPSSDEPPLMLEAGYAFVDDPQFVYRSFAVVRAAAGWRRFEARPSLWIAAADDNQRWRGELAYRRPSLADGSFVDVAAATTFHQFGSDRFDVFGIELLGTGRLDLARVGPTLRGCFAELAVGLGSERIAYDVGAVDWNGNLLGGFAFGLYLGDGGGEARLYYDHRRDDYAGGLATARGGGFLGHFGLAGSVAVAGGWGVAAEVERGAANIVRIGAQYRFGGGLR